MVVVAIRELATQNRLIFFADKATVFNTVICGFIAVNDGLVLRGNSERNLRDYHFDCFRIECVPVVTSFDLVIDGISLCIRSGWDFRRILLTIEAVKQCAKVGLARRYKFLGFAAVNELFLGDRSFHRDISLLDSQRACGISNLVVAGGQAARRNRIFADLVELFVVVAIRELTTQNRLIFFANKATVFNTVICRFIAVDDGLILSCDCERSLGNVRGDASRLVRQIIVTFVGTSERESAEGDCDSFADISIRKYSRSVFDADIVVAQNARYNCRSCDSRGCCAVIDFVCCVYTRNCDRCLCNFKHFRHAPGIIPRTGDCHGCRASVHIVRTFNGIIRVQFK